MSNPVQNNLAKEYADSLLSRTPPVDESKVGRFFLLQTEADLKAIYYVPENCTRRPAPGDVVYISKTMAGAYVYQLVHYVTTAQVSFRPGVSWAGDAAGLLLDVKLSTADRAEFEKGEAIKAPLHAAAAQQLRGMEDDMYVLRLQNASVGHVLIGKGADGNDLFPGGCAMVLDTDEALDPKLTLMFKENGKRVRRKAKASTLVGARIADDPGMEALSPDMGLYVAEFLTPGTIVRFHGPQYFNHRLWGVRQLFNSHGLIKKVSRRSRQDAALHLSMSSLNGYMEEVTIPLWMISDIELSPENRGMTILN